MAWPICGHDQKANQFAFLCNAVKIGWRMRIWGSGCKLATDGFAAFNYNRKLDIK